MNLGLAYRYYFNSSIYLGARTKYNWVDYTANDVLPYTGHTITTQLSLGFVLLAPKHSRLKELEYPLRQ